MDETRRSWRRLTAAGEVGVGTRFSFSRAFSAEEVAAFGALTRDDNPVHSDQRWCEAKGFERPICHGLLVGSMLCDPGGQLGWLASSMSFRFHRPTYLGDRITCEMVILSLDGRGRARAEAVLKNERGEVVITADLEGLLPTEAERPLLAELVEEGEP